MANYTDLLDDIMPDLPGCSIALVTSEVRSAAIDLCRRTLCLQEIPEPINIVESQSAYTVPVSTNQVTLNTIIKAYVVDGETITLLEPYGRDALDALDKQWRSSSYTSSPTAYYIHDGVIYLVPTPSAAIDAGLNLVLSMQPSLISTTINDQVFSDYRDVISHGALASLFAMHRKPWSNGPLAEYHRQQFELQVGRSGFTVAKDSTRASLRTKAYFGVA